MRLRVSASAALRSARLSGEMRAGRGGRAHLSGVPGVASEGGVALTRRPRDCIFIEFALSSLIPDTLAQGSVESTQLEKGSVESIHKVVRQNLRKGQLNRAIDTQGTASLQWRKAQANWDKPLPHEALPRSGRAARWTKLLCLKMNGSNPHTRRRHIVKIPTANDAPEAKRY